MSRTECSANSELPRGLDSPFDSAILCTYIERPKEIRGGIWAAISPASFIPLRGVRSNYKLKPNCPYDRATL